MQSETLPEQQQQRTYSSGAWPATRQRRILRWAEDREQRHKKRKIDGLSTKANWVERRMEIRVKPHFKFLFLEN